MNKSANPHGRVDNRVFVVTGRVGMESAVLKPISNPSILPLRPALQAPLPDKNGRSRMEGHELEIVSPGGGGGDAKNLEAPRNSDKEKVEKTVDFRREKCCEFFLDKSMHLGSSEERNYRHWDSVRTELAKKLLRQKCRRFNPETFEV